MGCGQKRAPAIGFRWMSVCPYDWPSVSVASPDSAAFAPMPLVTFAYAENPSLDLGGGRQGGARNSCKRPLRSLGAAMRRRNRRRAGPGCVLPGERNASTGRGGPPPPRSALPGSASRRSARSGAVAQLSAQREREAVVDADQGGPVLAQSCHQLFRDAAPGPVLARAGPAAGLPRASVARSAR